MNKPDLMFCRFVQYDLRKELAKELATMKAIFSLRPLSALQYLKFVSSNLLARQFNVFYLLTRHLLIQYISDRRL
jgi:hypothetical protein